MNSEITIEINGYKRNILRYEYGFNRDIDLKGRPISGLLGGKIYVEMESDDSSDILEMLLIDMNRPCSSFFWRNNECGRLRPHDYPFHDIPYTVGY